MASRGGARPGAGRKSRAEVMELPMLIEDCIGKEGKRELILAIWEKAKNGSYLHQQLLMAYIFGKPQDHVDITSAGNEIKQVLFIDAA